MADPAFERILVTGGTGFIGRYVVDLLLREGFRPLITTFTGRSLTENKVLSDIDVVKLDLTDASSTNDLVQTYRPQIVINLAGATGHDDPTGTRCHAINFNGTVNLLNALDRNGVGRVILLGSAAEYGDQSTPFTEAMPAQPASEYGCSKAKATSFAMGMHAANEFPVTVLRVFSAFGYGQPAKMFLSQLITHGLQNRHFKMSDGLQKRDYVHAADVAIAIRAAVTVENAVGKTINIASGRATVLRELALQVWDLCGADKGLLEIGSVEKTGDDGFDTEADITLAEQILGWLPQNSILDEPGKHFALPELIRQMKECADGQ